MPDRYQTPSDARMRLDSTIIRYKGEPVYARLNNDASFDAHLYDLRKMESLSGKEALFATVNANDEDLDISSCPLGFVNSKRGAIFTARTPARRQKQGIDTSALKYFQLDKHADGLPNLRDFRDTILGEYPTFDAVKHTTKSLAWNRHFAILGIPGSKKFSIIFCKENRIGLYQHNIETIFLDQRNKHLGVFLSDKMQIDLLPAMDEEEE